VISGKDSKGEPSEPLVTEAPIRNDKGKGSVSDQDVVESMDEGTMDKEESNLEVALVLDAFDSAISHHLSSMVSSVFLRMTWRSIHTYWSGLLRLYPSMEIPGGARNLDGSFDAGFLLVFRVATVLRGVVCDPEISVPYF
jgi:hypothetical protein